uniref:Uncharacterized protein n=1 Tax=viral metagenome TaxID=1070528 RepID=A0A6M3IZX5_9ZZZZ
MDRDVQIIIVRLLWSLLREIKHPGRKVDDDSTVEDVEQWLDEEVHDNMRE